MSDLNQEFKQLLDKLKVKDVADITDSELRDLGDLANSLLEDREWEASEEWNDSWETSNC